VDDRALLDGLLAHDFRGVEALRDQAQTLTAKKGCECGCGTIELAPVGTDLPISDAASPVPVEGIVIDTNGDAIGGLLLFLVDGLLNSLEVYSYDQPLPLPTIDFVRWDARPA